MSFSIGIVGLPNVGKSTLFNALTRSKQADAANYPFCTIDPNVGVVEVPDDRLAKLAEISKSKKTIPTAIEFVDIAGLVKGASLGEGLGNKFLSHIREVDAIAQVVRAFSDGNVIHVHNKVDPKNDSEVINLELALADLQIVSKRLENAKKAAKGVVTKDKETEIALLTRVKEQLEQGKPARALDYSEEERDILKELQLLTAKPMLYVVNVDEADAGSSIVIPTTHSFRSVQAPEESLSNLSERMEIPRRYGSLGMTDVPQIIVSAKLEAELADLSVVEAKEYLKTAGITQTGLDKLIIASYKLLDLITYFTSGEPETRAWTVKSGAKAPAAAGVIHTDFVKGFIKADVVNWEDFVAAGGWSKIKETGKLRLEGKDYVVRDGDVVYFHVNV